MSTSIDWSDSVVGTGSKIFQDRTSRQAYRLMIGEEARILIDQEGFFRERLDSLRGRLKELGAKKVRRDGN